MIKDGTDREADIIVRSPRYVLPFEVKYRKHPALREKSGLKQCCRLEGIDRAYLVTRRDRDFRVLDFAETAKIPRIPAHILCLMLGQAERDLWRQAAAS